MRRLTKLLTFSEDNFRSLGIEDKVGSISTILFVKEIAIFDCCKTAKRCFHLKFKEKENQQIKVRQVVRF